MLDVGRNLAVEPRKVQVRPADQCRQPRDEVQRFQQQVDRAITKGDLFW
jgi:hypothetical protein